MATTSTLYPSSSRTEADLREELTRMFLGGPNEIAKAHRVLLRRMRVEDGSLLVCDCVDSLTHEPDKDHECPFCLGEGYYWDEEWAWTRKVVSRGALSTFSRKDTNLEGGILNVQSAVFFFEYDVAPTYYDKVVELVMDAAGDPAIPYTRRKIYKPHTVIDYRSDTGRIEYWALYCIESDAILFEETFIK